MSSPRFLWEDREPRRRGRRQPTREQIVTAALELADAEGFDAVSMRRVATELRAGTMTLYSYVTSKDDLVQLMLDEVMADQVVPGELPADWRGAMRAIQRQTRAAFLDHPWMVAAIGKRVQAGPNTLRHVDQCVGALASLDVPLERKMAILGALDDYTIGHAAREVAMQERASGFDAATEEALRPHYEAMIASGAYPNLVQVAEADPREWDLDTFELGLEWLLAGIAASVESSASSR